MGASEAISFSVAEAPESFPTTLVATSFVGSVIVVGVVLRFYFKKRKL
jgi:hypothetical protein